MDPGSQGDMGQLLPREERKGMSGIQESLRVPLSVTSPVLNVHGKLHQPNPGRTKSGQGPSGMKVGITTAGEMPQAAELLAELKGIWNGRWKKIVMSTSSNT
ncbi:hypothetical protein H1C71_025409 [Ictidomys tridecemlineatus]|nr:hypothetical protein H1C71_025409 [Ictidomys tridecemlineatus]